MIHALLLSLAGCGADGVPTRESTQDRVAIAGATFGQGHIDAEPGPYGDAWRENEQPQHRVTVSAFEIDRAEVTVEGWAAFLNDIDPISAFHHPLQPVRWGGTAFSPAPDEAKRPVRHVSWFGAVAFCAWAGGRLPTEAEWELAARGPDTDDAYPWGTDRADCLHAVYFTNAVRCAERPERVGSRSPEGDSPDGLHDMAGNVAEWVMDRYGPYTSDALSDPAGPTEGALRVMRGGGFQDVDDSIRTQARWGVAPDRHSEGVGFRCAYGGGQP